MTYRSLLVPLDTTPANVARTRIAIALARQFDARLEGLYHPAATDLAADFQHHCQAAGLAAFEPVADAATPADALTHHAACADLLVMSQPDPSLPDYRSQLAELETLLLASARPVLLIPYTHLDPFRPRHVLVAWDGSRESVRAVSDALPMLRQAERVTLLHWRQEADGTQAQQQLDSVAQWLALQGVQAQPRDEVTVLAVGEAMLNAASDHGADLIVMGAYCHARWAERLFGGVSRTLLQSMTVPVLMSH